MASKEDLSIYREVCMVSGNHKLTVIDVKNEFGVVKEGLIGFKTFDECKQVLDDLKIEYPNNEFEIVSFTREYDDKLWEIESREIKSAYDTIDYFSENYDHYLWDEDMFYQHIREKIDEYIEDKDLRLVKLYANEMYEKLGIIIDIIETAKEDGINGEYMYCDEVDRGVVVPYECMQFSHEREVKAIGIISN